MIKLQRCAWGDANKTTKANIGAPAILPRTFTILNTEATKNFESSQKKYRGTNSFTAYEPNTLTLEGTIFSDGSHTAAETYKNQLVAYVSAPEPIFISIYLKDTDTKHWIGVVSNISISYENDHTVLSIRITFKLEEPFRISDTKTVITKASDAETLITNNSNISFYPEKVVVTTLEMRVRPEFDTAAAYTTTLYRAGLPLNTIYYPKEFKNMDGILPATINRLITIPAGNFYLKGIGTLEYYERWL